MVGSLIKQRLMFHLGQPFPEFLILSFLVIIWLFSKLSVVNISKFILSSGEEYETADTNLPLQKPEENPVGSWKKFKVWATEKRSLKLARKENKMDCMLPGTEEIAQRSVMYRPCFIPVSLSQSPNTARLTPVF